MPNAKHQQTLNARMLFPDLCSFGAILQSRHSPMNTRGLVWLGLIGTAAAAFYAGRQTAPQRVIATTNSVEVSSSSANKGLLVKRVNAKTEPELNAEDFTSRLRAAAAAPTNKRWQLLRDLARSVSPKDAPRALAIAEKILRQNEFYNFRYNVLEVWAENDPKAVLAYAETLKSRMDRNAAFTAALTGLGKID